MRVLVIDDEAKVASFIAQGFRQEGYAVDVASDGEEGLQHALAFDYDLVILDVMLPKLSGLDVVSRLRSVKPRMPVIMLSAKGETGARIAGLDRGADDYMTKPFAFAELSARTRALLRRGVGDGSAILQVADLAMDPAMRLVRRNDQPVDLKPREYALLEFLMRHAHRPVTRHMIIEHVWDIHFDNVSNVVDVHINALRNKIDRGFDRPLIHTIRGVGYVLTDQKP